MSSWDEEDSINDVAEQMVKDYRVSPMVETLMQAYPVLREISHSFHIPNEHIHEFRNLIDLAYRMTRLVDAQMRTFYDPRD